MCLKPFGKHCLSFTSLAKLHTRTRGNILYQRRHQQNTPHHPAERLDQKANRHTCFGQRGNLQSHFTSI